MGLFNWGANKAVDLSAKEFAAEFAMICPLPAQASKKNILAGKKLDEVLAQLFAKVKSFRIEHRLGVFKRARFAKIFQDELTRLGYEAELVNKVTTAMVAAALSGN